MAILVRKINKAKWQGNPELSWLAEDDIQSDALGDLQTKGNTLSVYEVEDNQEAIDRVVTALAANGEYISNIDYVVIDPAKLLLLSIEMHSTLGDTADEEINRQHKDLTQLTVTKILSLASIVVKSPKTRKLQKAMVRCIAEGIRNKNLNREKIRLKEEQLQKVDKLLL